MARHIRVPGIVDLVRAVDPAEIRALDEEPQIDRHFVPRGPLVNRLVTRRIRRWFQVNGLLLPSLAPRGDAVRAAEQARLADRLVSRPGHPLWTDEQIGPLVDFVLDRGSREDAGIAVQRIVGRQFHPDYEADRASWRAAEIIDKFRDGFSPIQLVWLISGRLRRARDLLQERARQDRWAMHGTAIGVHGIIHALERMRALRAKPGAASLADEAVLGRCLVPPRQVPRTVEAMLSTPATARRLRPGTIVLFELGAAWPQAPDPEMVFMHGHWNACPAQTLVVGLLKDVWRKAA